MTPPRKSGAAGLAAKTNTLVADSIPYAPWAPLRPEHISFDTSCAHFRPFRADIIFGHSTGVAIQSLIFQDFSGRSRLFPTWMTAPDYSLPKELLSTHTIVDNELRSLFALIDDPDIRVAEAVEERLRTRGIAVMMPLFEFAHSASGLARERALQIGRELNVEVLAEEFDTLDKQLAADDPNALEDGVFLIARYGNPALHVDYYKSFLDDYAGVLRNRIAKRSSPLEVLNECNYLFFEEFKYRGNQTKFMDPENSYIHRVIERKSGIPISLAVLYLLVVETRLKLPFSGASAPGHFLIRYDGLSTSSTSEPLFVDAFNGGVILRERDIKRYLDTSGLPFNRGFLDPASPRSVLLRMIRNLIIVFNENSDTVGRAAFERFMRILAPDSPEGIAFLRGLES